MLEPGRRVVVAFAVVAVLFGVVAQRSDVGGRTGTERDRPPASAMLADPAPVGVVPAAGRPRSSLDGELRSSVTSPKLRVSGLVLVLAVLAVTMPVCWSCLVRPDRRLAVPLRRSSLAPLRAPPASA